MTLQPHIWFVTGASRGLGEAIAGAALKDGGRVVGTFRHGDQADQFTRSHPAALGVVMDVTDQLSIAVTIAGVLAMFGRIDVLVNNAGGGLFGAIEEVDDEDFRALMDVNVFGALAVTRAVLPQMRKQRSGLIFQMSSISGVRAMEGLGSYAASKFALEGASEALALELIPLGIRVIIVEPGPFRTEWIAGAIEFPSRRISDYAGTAHATIERLNQLDGKQAGSPERAASVLVSVAKDASTAPLRLTLGPTAQARLGEKLVQMQENLRLSIIIGASTDYE